MIKPRIHAADTSLRTVEILKLRGIARVDKYLSMLITVIFFNVMDGNNTFKNRSTLQDQAC